MRAFTTVFCIFLLCSVEGQTWEPRQDLPTTPFRAATSFVIGEHGYVCGGYDGVRLSACWKYSPQDDTWNSIAPLPRAVGAPSGFELNGKGYIVGGYSDSPLYHSNEVFEYDPMADSWTQKNDFPFNPRYGMFSFKIAGEQYVGCGNSGTSNGPFHHDCFRYNVSSDSWEAIADFPGLDRYGCTGFSHEGKGYVLGGGDVNGQSSDLWMYDPLLNQWEMKSSIPNNASYQAVLTFMDHVVVLGSSSHPHISYTYFPDQDIWTTDPYYPGGSAYTSVAFQVGNRSFVGTGYDGQIQEYHNDLWEYIEQSPSDLTEIEESGLILFPNPMNERTVLDLGDLKGEVLLEIIDMGAKLVRTRSHQAELGTLEIPRGNLAKGNYILRLSSEGQRYELKMGVE